MSGIDITVWVVYVLTGVVLYWRMKITGSDIFMPWDDKGWPTLVVFSFGWPWWVPWVLWKRRKR